MQLKACTAGSSASCWVIEYLSVPDIGFDRAYGGSGCEGIEQQLGLISQQIGIARSNWQADLSAPAREKE